MKHDPDTCPTCGPYVNTDAARRGAAKAAASVAGTPTLVEVLAEENPALQLLQATR